MRLQNILIAFVLTTLVLVMGPVASATEVEQYFPAAAAGSNRQSAWRIKYEILPRGNGYGHSEVWHFESIEFMRGFLTCPGIFGPRIF